jgi:hypothetical protein
MNTDLTLNTNFGTSNYTGDYTAPYPDYWWNPHIYTPIVKEYYPVYYGYWNQDSKLEKAFKIVAKLMDMKMIKCPLVKDFIETVNNIAEIL